MLGKVIVLGLAAASLSGTVAVADLRDQYYSDALRLRQLQQQQRQLEQQGLTPEQIQQQERIRQQNDKKACEEVSCDTRFSWCRQERQMICGGN